MRSWTFSLTSLLGVMTLLAVDFGAIVADSHFATSASYTIFLGLLCFAAAASFTAPQDRRAFWVGFATFGLVYALAVFERPPTPGAGSPFSPLGYSSSSPYGSSSNFITDDLLDMVEGSLASRHEVGSHVYARWLSNGYYWGTIIGVQEGQYQIKWDDGSTPTWQSFRDVAGTSANRRVALHSTVATVWALVGGAIVAFWLSRQGKAQAPP